MPFPIMMLAGALPTIIDTLKTVNDEFDLIGNEDAERITGIASQALALAPEAIDAFMKLKETLGGRKPSANDLRNLRLEIAAKSEDIAAAARSAHDRPQS